MDRSLAQKDRQYSMIDKGPRNGPKLLPGYFKIYSRKLFWQIEINIKTIHKAVRSSTHPLPKTKLEKEPKNGLSNRLKV